LAPCVVVPEALALGLDRREIAIRQKTPLFLGILHMAVFARDNIGAFATLGSEHDCFP
jgi:hypothetical protein